MRYELSDYEWTAIKQCQRVATRYDKLAANYLAFVKLASIRIWVRANESMPWIKGLPAYLAVFLRLRFASTLKNSTAAANRMAK
jgi:hypothetical protein